VETEGKLEGERGKVTDKVVAESAIWVGLRVGEWNETTITYLEDHPRTCKWLITMVSKSPKWGYSPSKWAKWLINGGY